MGSGPASPAPGPRNQWREERGPHGARRWVNTRTGRIQYRDPGHPHPAFVEKQKEQRSKQEESAKEQGNSHDKGELSEPKKDVAKVLDTAAFDAHIKQHKTPELPHNGSAPLADLASGGTVFSDDIYSNDALQIYGTGDDVMDNKTLKILRNLLEALNR